MAGFARTLLLPTGEHPLVHSFRHDNGRVARLLMNLVLLRAGYPIAVIPVERRAQYIDALRAAQSFGDEAPLLSLVADAVEASLRDTLAACVSSGDAVARDVGTRVAVEAWLWHSP